MRRPTALASARAWTGSRRRPACCSADSARSAASTRFGGTVNVKALVSTIMPRTCSRCVGDSTLFWTLTTRPSPWKSSTSSEAKPEAASKESNMNTQSSMYVPHRTPWRRR